MISMFITSLWTSDRVDEFYAVRRRLHVGSPYQDSIISQFQSLVNTFLKKCIRRVIKNKADFEVIWATIHKTDNDPTGLSDRDHMVIRSEYLHLFVEYKAVLWYNKSKRVGGGEPYV